MNIKTKLALGLAFIAVMFIAMLTSPDFMLNNVSILIGVLLGIAYVPQIVEIFKKRTAKGLNIDFIIILNCALTTALMNSVYVMLNSGIWGYLVIEVINESLALFVLGLMLYFGQGDPRK